MEDNRRGDSWKFILNAYYFTSYYQKKCKHNPNVPKFLLKYTNNIIKIALKGGLFSQVVMIQSSIQKTKLTEEASVEDEDPNNESEINTQNEDINDIDSPSVKDKDKTCPSEATEETKY